MDLRRIRSAHHSAAHGRFACRQPRAKL